MKMHRRTVVAALVAILLPVESALAVPYAASYSEALKLAQQTGRPVAVLVLASWCGWCRKLESETMTSGKVNVLISKFVFVKIDADREKELAQKLRSTALPFTAFIDKKEKPLGSIEGFVTAEVFVEQAQAAYQKAGPIIAERDIQRINIELQKAQKAYEQGDYPTAIGKLSAIAKLELQLEQVAQAKKLLDKITQEGTAQLHEAKALADQEKFEEAIAQINEIARKFAGTPAEAAAKDVLSKLMSNPALVQRQKEAEALALLQKAKEAYSAEDYATALQRLQQIANSYPDTSAGSVAQQQLAAMNADEVIMKQIADAKADAKCKSLLSMARSFEMNKDFKRAIECYDKMINEFPASSFAEEARRRKAEAEKLL